MTLRQLRKSEIVSSRRTITYRSNVAPDSRIMFIHSCSVNEAESVTSSLWRWKVTVGLPQKLSSTTCEFCPDGKLPSSECYLIKQSELFRQSHISSLLLILVFFGGVVQLIIGVATQYSAE